MSEGKFIIGTKYNAGREYLDALGSLNAFNESLIKKKLYYQKTLTDFDTILESNFYEDATGTLNTILANICPTNYYPGSPSSNAKHSESFGLTLTTPFTIEPSALEMYANRWVLRIPPCVPKDGNDRGAFLRRKIYELNEDIRKGNFSTEKALQLRGLIAELYQLVTKFLKATSKNIKRCRKKILLIRLCDLRKLYRSIIHILFKSLDAFSGCEDEEELFTTNRRSRSLFSFLKQKENAKQKRFNFQT